MGSSSYQAPTLSTRDLVPSSEFEVPLSLNEQRRVDLIRYVDTVLVGKKWVHQGRNPVSGFDCIGFILLCSWYLGERTKDFTAYGEEPKSSLLVANTQERAVRISLSQSIPGDFFIFWVNENTRRPRHFGMLGYNRAVYHSDRRLGGLAKDLNSEQLNRVDSVWRFKSLSMD